MVISEAADCLSLFVRHSTGIDHTVRRPMSYDVTADTVTDIALDIVRFYARWRTIYGGLTARSRTFSVKIT